MAGRERDMRTILQLHAQAGIEEREAVDHSAPELTARRDPHAAGPATPTRV